MSLYGQYVQERSGYHIIETADAFATYSFHNGFVVIRDLYVCPEKRRSGIAAALAKRIITEALDRDCHTAWATADPQAMGFPTSAKAIKASGFVAELHGADGLVWFKKDLSPEVK